MGLLTNLLKLALLEVMELFEGSGNKTKSSSKTSNLSGSHHSKISVHEEDDEPDEPKIQLGELKDGVLTLWDEIEELNDESLEEYKHLRRIVFPASLKSLESTVIDDQEKLEEIDFTKVTKLEEIPDDFISGEHKIHQFVIPAGVKTVGDGFMGEAEAGTVIYVPESVRKLGYINGRSNNDLIVYLYASDVDLTDAEEDIKTLYVLKQDIAQYAKQLKECDSEVRLREMPEDKRGFYGSNTSGSQEIADEEPKHEKDSSENLLIDETQPSDDNMETEEEEIQNDGYIVDIEGNTTAIPGDIEVIDNEYKFGGIKKIVFPGSVKRIFRVAFYGCNYLEEVDFSQCKLLESIDESAFEGCKQLEQIDFSQCNLLESIGKSAFKGTHVRSIVLPPSLKVIGESAFEICDQLEEVDFSQCDHLISIGKRAFWDTHVKSIVLPPSLKEIGGNAFYGCDQLEEVDFSQCKLLESIGECAFDHSAIKELDFSQCSLLESIGKSAFSSTNIRSVVLPPSLKEIGEYAFEGCEQLEEVDFSQCKLLESIGECAFDHSAIKELDFSQCAHLKSLGKKLQDYQHNFKIKQIIFPPLIEEIPKNFCREIDTLERVDLSNSTRLKRIGEAAFYELPSLKEVLLPDSVEVLDKWALCACGSGFKSIVMPASLKEMKYGVFMKTKLRSIDFSKVTLLETIPEEFLDNDHIKTLKIPNGVETIEDKAFSVDKLKTLFLPPTLESFGSFNHFDLDLYCFSPKLDELEPLVEDLKEGQQLRLHVLPQYLSAYVKQRDEEGVSEDNLSIQEIPAEYLNYYDK